MISQTQTTTTGESVQKPEPVVITGRKRELAFKVSLEGPDGKTVILQASPVLSEGRTAVYDGYGITHLPTELFSYKFTSSRKFQVQGRLISRNVPEAQENSKYLDLIRTWILPDFGRTGATPPIIKLYGFNNPNIDGTQCAIKSYSFVFPDDVDFIYEANPPMPVIGQLTIELDEIYSAQQITDEAWRLKVGKGGSFEGEATTQKNNLLPPATGIADVKPTGVNTNSVTKNPSNLPSSTKITDDDKRVAKVNNNSFLKGLSLDKLVSKATAALAQVFPAKPPAPGTTPGIAPPTTASDGFRTPPLIPPSYIKF